MPCSTPERTPDTTMRSFTATTSRTRTSPMLDRRGPAKELTSFQRGHHFFPVHKHNLLVLRSLLLRISIESHVL